MEKSKPMELGLGELLSNQNIVNNNSFRFINRDLGIVVSFAQMDSILFSTGKPYRTRESRIIRILKGEARISINLIEYKVKEPMIIISPCNSLIEIIEISEDYDFQVIVPDNNFLHLFPCKIVKCGKRLIHHDKGRLIRQRPRDRRPLLHSAGELCRICFFKSR